MDQIQREKIKAKLEKIKALAERGVGGEKETAIQMYEELKAKYEIEDEEIMQDEVTLHWFSYSTPDEERLLVQIFYAVTGSPQYHTYIGKYSRRKKRGCDCTELEALEITLRFEFYKREWEKEKEALWIAFRHSQQLFPDENTRVQEQEEEDEERPERTQEEKEMLRRAGLLAFGMEKKEPPRPQGLLEESGGDGG